MTIEEWLGKSADELEAMSSAELEEHFAWAKQFTRPELAPKPEPRGVKKIASVKDEKKELANQMLERLGFTRFKIK